MPGLGLTLSAPEPTLRALENTLSALAGMVLDAREQRDTANAQVQAVRDQWARCECDRCKSNHTAILHILDGGESDA